MHVAELPLSDQVFTHIDSNTGKSTVYAVTRIREHCYRNVFPVYMTPLEPNMARIVLRERGLEAPRLQRALLTKKFQPFVFLTMPDGTHLAVDGSHTYVARCLLGHTWALAYIVPESVWRDFIVEGVGTEKLTKAELLTSYSGIPIGAK